MSKATPRPWNREAVNFRHSIVDDCQNGTWELLATFGKAADRDFALRAVNCHDELVSECEALLKIISQTGGETHKLENLLKRARGE